MLLGRRTLEAVTSNIHKIQYQTCLYSWCQVTFNEKELDLQADNYL